MQFVGASSPEAGPTEIVSPVTMFRLKDRTQKNKIMRNLVALQKLGTAPFSNRYYRKNLKKAEAIGRQDEQMNDFLRYFDLMPSGGEYLMPVSTAKSILEDIYGTEPSIQVALAAGQQQSQEGGVFERLDSLRRKPDPAVMQATKAASTSGIRNIPYLRKLVGSIPEEALTGVGKLGVRGGSAVDSSQSVWVSGASVSYDFDAGDTLPP